jgi:NADH-quinone oxidoreductase subunit L
MSHAQGLLQASSFGYLWLIPLFPLLGAAINGLGGFFLMRKFGPKVNHSIAVLMPSLSFVVTVIAFFSLLGLPEDARALHQVLFPFIHVGFFDADFAFWFDPLSATLTLIITFVGTLIHVYSIGYMKGDDSYWRFFAYLNLFMSAMLMLVLGDNFMIMFIGWEGVGLCSYLLISFWYKEKANAVAGMKAFVVNRVGDFAFVLGLAFLFWGMMGNFTNHSSQGLTGVAYSNDRLSAQSFGPGGKTLAEVLEPAVLKNQSQGHYHSQSTHLPPTSLRFDAARAIITKNRKAWEENSPTTKTLLGVPLVVIVCILLFIAATGKSAQIPLYVWLPDAMAGPTPVSALIHAATMVTAGVYMVARLSFLFSLSPTAMTVVTVVGALTAFFAATIGLFQYDIKKVLAYSTVSQLGYMFIGVGCGAYWAGVYHLLTHALFKATLFLCSGSVILGCHHEQDMRKMGGLKKYMPSTHWTYYIACVCITTAPVFFLANGFYSKDEILWKAFDAGHLLVPGWSIWVLGIVGAAFTSFYMWRSYYMTFTGEYRGGDAVENHDEHDAEEHHHHTAEPHESPATMTYVLWTLAGLAVASIALGFWPLLGGLLHMPALTEPIFEHWLHPVVGAAYASDTLQWLHKIPGHLIAGLDMHTWELILALLSICVTMASWLTARALYKDAKSALPAALLNHPSPLLRRSYRLVFNKYFVDEIYQAVVVNRVHDLSRFLYAVDAQVVDGTVNLMGRIGKFVGLIDGLFDSIVVDGMVNLIASGVGAAGNVLRRTQTGRIQIYLAGAVCGVLFLVLVNFIVFQFV